MSENRFEDKKFPQVVFNSLSKAKLEELKAQGLINEGEWYVTNDTFKDHAGGLDVLDIGQSLYIDETQGLRRWLNGQWVDINDNTRLFYEKLLKASSLYPDILCTPSEYENIIAQSAFNQCGKFAIDTVSGKIRLPKIVYANGALNISNIGNLGSERILVAKKEPTADDHSWWNWYSDGWLEQGNWVWGATDGWYTQGFLKTYNVPPNVRIQRYHTNAGDDGSTLDRRHTIIRNITTTGFNVWGSWAGYGYMWIAEGYANKPTEADFTIDVGPIQYYYIQIATGLETVVDIENKVQLNNPYSLGDSKYSPVMLSNVSWLAGGAQGTRIAYPSYYDFLYKIYAGEITRGGITVKTADDPTLNKLDHVIDTVNETFTMPTLNGTEDTPSDNLSECSIDFSAQVTASPTTLTAPYNGWFRIGTEYQAEKSVHLYNHNTDMNSVMSAGSSGDWALTQIWANRGDLVEVSYNATTNRFVNFKIATKPGYLYFYVGETVQNANLINAGKLTDVASTTMGDWVNPTATSRTYCRRFADGWCEQGGYYYVGATMANNNYKVVFPQPFKDTNYVFSFNHVYPGNGTADCGCENWTQRTPQSATVYNGTGGWQGFSWRASGYFK